MPITYKVEVQPQALRDMTEIVTYIADDLKNPGAAERLAERLVHAIESLTRLPSRCPLYLPSRPLRREYRRLRVESYLVLFTMSEKDEVVTVARVLYAKRELDAHLK